MGQVASIPYAVYNYYYPPPLLPEAINEKDVRSRTAGKQVLESLQQRGYVVIKTDTDTSSLVKGCKETVGEFFLLPAEEKKRYETAYSTDPLLKGRRPNRGYIEGKAKEYLKIRMIDKTEAYPKQPTALEETFKNTMGAMHDIAYNALLSLGTVPIAEDPEKTWLDKKVTESVSSFIPEGSSVSVIKYYQVDGDIQDDHEPLGEHVDTGIMTLIRISEVQGLVVFDQLHQKYLNIEELAKVGDLVLIMGRKIEFLLEKGVKLTPTLHKVVIPKNKERFSILFFMDLPGGKDV